VPAVHLYLKIIPNPKPHLVFLIIPNLKPKAAVHSRGAGCLVDLQPNNPIKIIVGGIFLAALAA
jgi:hypothetical protein